MQLHETDCRNMGISKDSLKKQFLKRRCWWWKWGLKDLCAKTQLILGTVRGRELLWGWELGAGIFHHKFILEFFFNFLTFYRWLYLFLGIVFLVLPLFWDNSLKWGGEYPPLSQSLFITCPKPCLWPGIQLVLCSGIVEGLQADF